MPGEFVGGLTRNRFFLMRPVGEPRAFGWETEAIRWVHPDDASRLIQETTNDSGRVRDLAILAAAVEAIEKLDT